MKVKFHFSLLLILILGFMACRKPQGGSLSVREQTKLEILAERQIATEEKIHQLAEILSKVLLEALSKDDDTAMLNHLKDFNSLNEDALKQLTAEIDFWFKHVDKEEKNEFLMRYWPEDYTKSLRESEARFFRRTRQRPEYQEILRQTTRPLEMRK